MDGSASPEQKSMTESVLLNQVFNELIAAIPQGESYQLPEGSRGSIAWWLDYQRVNNPTSWQSETTAMVNRWKSERLSPSEIDYQLALGIYDALYPMLEKEIKKMPEGEEKEARLVFLSRLEKQKGQWEGMKNNGDRIPVNIVPLDRWPGWHTAARFGIQSESAAQKEIG